MKTSVRIAPERFESFEQLVESCLAAIRQYEAAEVALFEYLERIEKEHANTWRAACASFEEFIVGYIRKPEPRRYANFRAARQRLGIEVVRSIGIDAAVEALRIQEAAQQQTFIEASIAFAAENGGTHASKQHAREIRRDIAPVVTMPLPLRRMRERDALQQENAALRAELKAAREENEALRKENEALRKENEALRASGPAVAMLAPRDSAGFGGGPPRAAGTARKSVAKAAKGGRLIETRRNG